MSEVFQTTCADICADISRLDDEFVTVLEDKLSPNEAKQSKKTKKKTAKKTEQLPDTSAGLSYLEAKAQLMAAYSCCLAIVMQMKSEGRSIANHPVIEELITLRTMIEKAMPIEDKLKYQVEKLLMHGKNNNNSNSTDGADASNDGDEKGNSNGHGNAKKNDPLMLRPNINSFVSDNANYNSSNNNHSGSNVEDVNASNRINKKALRADERLARLAASSTILKELKEDFADTPAELSEAHASGHKGGKHANRLEAERTAYEEEYMVRVPMTKQEATRARQSRQQAVSGFNDELADLKTFGKLAKELQRRRTSHGGDGGATDAAASTGSNSMLKKTGKKRSLAELAKYLDAGDDSGGGGGGYDANEFNRRGPAPASAGRRRNNSWSSQKRK